MPKGGARVNSGPTPDPLAQRRDRASDQAGWTLLPAGGFDGPIPPWPLSRTIVTDDADMAEAVAGRERAHWRAVWRTPQAAVWARMGWTSDVALYCRHLAMAELGNSKAAGEARQWSDRLGLNPAAMLRNRWKVPADQLAAARDDRDAADPTQARGGSRSRLVRVAASG